MLLPFIIKQNYQGIYSTCTVYLQHMQSFHRNATWKYHIHKKPRLDISIHVNQVAALSLRYD